MKRNNLRWWGTIVSTLFILAATSCQKDDDPLSLGDNPFDLVNGGEAQNRNKIVVISDLHLGADLTYSECVHHLREWLNF